MIYCKTVASPNTLQMRSKPPLSGRIASLCAAELGVEVMVMAKVVFTQHRVRTCIKLTAGVCTVNVQQERVVNLPKRCSEVRALVLADVDIFHLFALGRIKVIDDVEVLEVSTDIVSEIHAMSRIAACCSPVG